MTTARVAFDRLAPAYDALVSGETFQLQRKQTHRLLSRWIRSGFRVLEIGCGTGADTAFLAGLGARVVACDPSDEMLSRTRRRLEMAGLGDRAGILSCGLQDLPHFLDALDHAEGFDAIVSNFGALNCAPSLAPLGVIGRCHLRAGGAMAIGLLGRSCLWETIYFTARGDREKASRRQASRADVPVAGIDVPTFYHRTSDVAASLGDGFVRDAVVGIGVLVPPPYLETRWQQVPSVLRRTAAGADRMVGAWPIVNELGDHTLSRWVKSGGPTMADLLVGQAYYLRFDPKLFQAQQPYAPLGTLYAASYLRERGHSVALFDAMLAQSVDEWGSAIELHRPRITAIYEDSFNYLSKMCLLRMREAALEMIDQAVRRRVPIVVSGSDATDHPELYLRRGAAAVILGEGDITIADLADRLLSHGSIEDVPGIAYLDDVCAVRRTSARPFIKSLDELPFPAWDLVEIDRYREIWYGRHGYYSMNIATTRGCPYHCNWCAKPIYGQRYATRTPKAVVEEMAWLKRRFAPDHLWVVDDVFGLKPGWVEEFAALVNEKDARVPFRCLMRADQVNASVAKALASAGCRMLWMGAESGSQKVLDAMEKGLRVEDIRTANRLLNAEGIDVGVFLQFGYPGETWSDIEATLQLAREIEPADIGVSVSYPLPGTQFYERVRQELGAKQNWVDSSDLTTMYKATYAPEVYRRVHGLVHHEFRARKSANALSALARSPWDMRPAHARRAASWIYNRAALALTRHRLRPVRHA